MSSAANAVGEPHPAVFGYLHPCYARSFEEAGKVRLLRRSGAWILERPVPGRVEQDCMGLYPLFMCRDWNGLSADLDDLQGERVSIAAIADPFGQYTPELLRDAFKDRVIPFKEHFVVDLSVPLERAVSRHHAYYARRALRALDTVVTEQPLPLLDDWARLYAVLVERHGITGIRAFSREAFALQLSTPGAVMLYATHGAKVVGAHVWYVHGETATSHLAAFSAKGYELMASYALYWRAMEYFHGRCDYLNLGAGAGLDASSESGLTRFKRGWATGTRTAYFCGRKLDPAKYEAFVEAMGGEPADYFPAYRCREFQERGGGA